MRIDIIEFERELQSSFLKTQKTIKKIYCYNSGLGYSDELKKAMNDLFKEMRQIDIPQLKLQELNEALQNTVHGINNKININDIRDVGKKLSDEVSAIAGAHSEEIRQLREFDFSSVFANEFINSGSLKESIDTAYEIVQKKFSETEIDDNKLEPKFSSAEELEEAINEHICNLKGFQERFAKWSQNKKIQYFIIWRIICFLWLNFYQPYFQDNIGKPATSYIVSNVKELPEKGAKIVCQLKQNIDAIILENIIHYYKVSFIDEDGNVKEGYVAKKNLKVLDEGEG